MIFKNLVMCTIDLKSFEIYVLLIWIILKSTWQKKIICEKNVKFFVWWKIHINFMWIYWKYFDFLIIEGIWKGEKTSLHKSLMLCVLRL
jgi:hypothetical protein